MLSISYLFESEVIFLHETLVEELFDTFDETLRPNYNKGFSDELVDHLKIICAKYGVNLEFSYVKAFAPTGKYYADTNTIKVEIPEQKHRVPTNRILNVIFHEYSHFVVEKARPGIFNPTEANKTFVNYKENPDIEKYNYQITIDYITELHAYTTQAHEKSQVAFTLAYDLYYDYGFKQSLFKNLIDAHTYAYAKSNYNNTEINSYMSKIGQSPGSQLFFRLIIFSLLLYKADNKKYLNLIQKLSKLLALADKYYKRLANILGDNKSNVLTNNIQTAQGNQQQEDSEFINKILPKRDKPKRIKS